MTYSLQTKEILPDILDTNIRILFIGAAPSRASADTGHYYADASDQFYQLLFEGGFTEEPLSPEQDHVLPEYRIGLTHLTKTRAVDDPDKLEPVDFSIGRLIRLVFEYSPEVVCFNGEIVFRQFFNTSAQFGPQKERIGGAGVYVVPASSAENDHRAYQEKLKWFRELYRILEQGDPD
ncbi:MAG: mismatch-specific DNA-glycosylase [Calditrichota bacterium]